MSKMLEVRWGTCTTRNSVFQWPKLVLLVLGVATETNVMFNSFFGCQEYRIMFAGQPMTAKNII
jgi:hypothetical protein